ncbi:wd repeat-containing protein [Anaeramoeba flamelloides]|uniref:Wd repeat-containing protein n=1 Tax=Anaeramoeba flamelloides TaxID=1746091 RepID=A0AAV7ZMI9_9EUKA|nr:wd repeat-containing protein [Anaeramoeba flamelloides]
MQNKTIVGVRNVQNKNSLDLNFNLLAYGSQSNVVIQEIANLQIVQVLSSHKSSVTAVKFNPTNISNNLLSPYNLTLVSGDSNGTVILWSVAYGSVLSILNLPRSSKVKTKQTKNTKHQKELPNRRSSNVQKSNSDLVTSGNKNFNSHPPNSVIDFWWISDINNQKTKPQYHKLLVFYFPSILRCWFIGNPLQEKPKLIWECDFEKEIVSIDLQRSTNSLLVGVYPKAIYKILNHNFKKKIQIPENYVNINSLSTKVKQNKVCQVLFYPHNPQFFFFLFVNELFVFDHQQNQIIEYRAITTKSPFWKITFSQANDTIFFILHQNATISVWNIKMQNENFTIKLMSYIDHYLISRNPKVVPTQKINFVLNLKNNQDHLYFISQYGNVWEWVYKKTKSFQNNSQEENQEGNQEKNSSKIKPIDLYGIYEPIRQSPLCISVCTFKKENETKHQNKNKNIAIGTKDGLIQIFDLMYSESKKVFSVCDSPILQIDWINPNLIICSTTVSLSKNTFQNQIFFLDLDSGDQKELPRPKDTEKMRLKRFELSKSKRYISILFHERKFELWDLFHMNLIQSLDVGLNNSGSFSWVDHFISNKKVENLENGKKKYEHKEEDEGDEEEGCEEENDDHEESFFFSIFGKQEMNKFTIEQDLLYKNNSFKINLNNFNILTIITNSSIVVFSTDSGNFFYLNLKKNKLIELKLKSQKKVKKIIFKPIKKTHIILILFIDGTVLSYDCKRDCEISIKKNKSVNQQVIDIDFANKSTPILLLKDNSLKLMNLDLNIINSPLKLLYLNIRPLSPQLYDRNFGLSLKLYLQFGLKKFTLRSISEKEKGVEMETDLLNKRKEQEDQKNLKYDQFKHYDSKQIDQYQQNKINTLKKISLNSNNSIPKVNSEIKKSWKNIGLVKNIFNFHENEKNDSQNLKPTNPKNKIKQNKKSNKLSLEQLIKREILLLSQDLIVTINNSDIIAERCYHVARYYNDDEEIKFWNLTKYYLNKFKAKIQLKERNRDNDDVFDVERDKNKLNLNKKKEDMGEKGKGGNDLINNNNNNINNNNTNASDDDHDGKENNCSGEKKKSLNLQKEKEPKKEKLPKMYGILREKRELIKEKNKLINIQNKKKKKNNKKIEQDCILYNQKEKALESLLSTPEMDEHYYERLLKSIVISSTINEKVFQQTIKLVSLSISLNKPLESVQLLCLIGDYKQACKHLIDINNWEEALSLCKLHLNGKDRAFFYKKYINFLIKENKFWDAIYFSLSIGMFKKVLKILIHINSCDIAYFFLISCNQFGFLSNDIKNLNIIDLFLKFSSLLEKLGLFKQSNYILKQTLKLNK